MKLSNKILIAFFSLAFLYLTALFGEIRFRGTPARIDESNSVAETVDIFGVKNLLVGDSEAYITVAGSDRPMIEVRSLSGNALGRIKYHLTGDTLELDGLTEKDAAEIKITVFVPRSGIETIGMNRGWIILRDVDQKALHVATKGGRVSIRNSRIMNTSITGSDEAIVEVDDTMIDSVTVRLDKSEAAISSRIKFLEGRLTNASALRLRKIGDIRVKKDTTSTLTVQEW